MDDRAKLLSADLKPPQGTSQAEVAPAWPKSSFFNNIKQVQSTKPDQKMSAWWYKHGETIITPHCGAAGGPDIQVPFHLSATSTDVKIRAPPPFQSTTWERVDVAYVEILPPHAY